MKEVMLVKNGELSLKGQNRNYFENILVRNIKRKIRHLGDFTILRSQSTIHIEPVEDFTSSQNDELEAALHEVFGIASICRSVVAKKDMEDIFLTASVFLKDQISDFSTFKVESRRSDKRFYLKSPEISSKLGGHILREYPHLSVDVHNPEITVYVEVRDNDTYIHTGGKRGGGGLPVGTSGKASVMMSGGIDSPVAAYMMARRGLKLIPVHFESPPYTSVRARDKVVKLCKKLSVYTGYLPLYIVNFTKIQEAIKDNCDEAYSTIIMRRLMSRITERISTVTKALAIVNGENLGQVASQTIEALAATDGVVDLPIFRPLIGMDKFEIIEIAKKIDTFETSILPYDDCCTVFTPERPKTKPKIKNVEYEEGLFDFEPLIEEAIKNVEVIHIDD